MPTFGPGPPHTGSEFDTLLGVLNDQRALMLWKLEGLDEEQASRPMVPSGTSLLGMVKHLVWVERWWFTDFIGDAKPDYPWSDEDPDADFRIEPGETIESISQEYDAAIGDANAVIGAAESLDVTGDTGRGPRSLRWVMVHMIEETACHLGQADILREQIDEVTGYYPPDDKVD